MLCDCFLLRLRLKNILSHGGTKPAPGVKMYVSLALLLASPTLTGAAPMELLIVRWKLMDVSRANTTHTSNLTLGDGDGVGSASNMRGSEHTGVTTIGCVVV